MESQKKPDTESAFFLGKILLGNLTQHLEAFSRNGLYCERGNTDMKQYKTVKEVCKLTGLTRKHLYYFHHENVVRAVSYANYSVEGNDGYKLYDQKAVEKLQQIALYYHLGLKRNEIRDLMLSPDYDSNTVLDRLLTRELEKQAQSNLNLAVLNCIKRTGTKNNLISILCNASWDALYSHSQESCKANTFVPPAQLTALLQKLAYANSPESILWELFERASREEFLYLLGTFVGTLGEGTASRSLSPEQGKTALRFLAEHPELYIQFLPVTEDE